MAPVQRYAERVEALTEGPPTPRAPERVTERTALRGKRVVVNLDGGWARDLRALDDPYWYDEETHKRWLPGMDTPAEADPARARLFVTVATERDWYESKRTKRRPVTEEYPAYLVWAEQ